MIWYSPELDEIFLLDVSGFAYREGECPGIRFNRVYTCGLDAETIDLAAWYYVGML